MLDDIKNNELDCFSPFGIWCMRRPKFDVVGDSPFKTSIRSIFYREKKANLLEPLSKIQQGEPGRGGGHLVFYPWSSLQDT